MGQVLHRGLLQGLEPVGGGRIMGAEAGVHHKLAEVGWFAESDQGGFGEEVLELRSTGCHPYPIP